MRSHAFCRYGLVSGLTVALGACAWLVWPRSAPQITPETCDRIEIGMTCADAQAVFKAAPGNYCTAPLMLLNADGTRPTPAQQPAAETQGVELVRCCTIDNHSQKSDGKRWWISDYGVCILTFDGDDRIIKKQFIAVCPVPAESVIVVIRRLCGI
jgi:hypothetical protein